MRGKADVVLNRIDRIGITPAYAGKRVIRSSFHKLFQDHPRLCGEKQHFFYFGSFANVGVGENDAVSGRIKCVQHSEKFS